MKKSRADVVQQPSWPPQPQNTMPTMQQTQSPFANTTSWYSATHSYGQPDMSRRNEQMDPYRGYGAPPPQQPPAQHHQQHPGAVQPPMTVPQPQHPQHQQQQHQPPPQQQQQQQQQQQTPTPAPAPSRQRKRPAPAAAPPPPTVSAPPSQAPQPPIIQQQAPPPVPAPAVTPISAPVQSAPADDASSTPNAPPAKKSRTNTPWTPAEEHRLKQMRDAGSSWAEIAKTFPTRTEGSVKKHWYKDMHYAEFAEDESQALMNAIKEYENNKWKVIGQKVGKPAKACEQYAKEHFPDLFSTPKQR